MKNKFAIVILPGDGIGPEVTQQAIRLFDCMNIHTAIQFEYEIIPCGGKYYLQYQQEWPQDAFEKCQRADAILLGAVGHVIDGKPVMTLPGKPYPSAELAGYAAVIGNRKKLELFANVRPIKLYEGILHAISGKYKQIWDPENIDYVIVRENTEDAYTGQFTRSIDKVITPIEISKKATENVVRFACELALKRNKMQKVMCVDKSNIIQAHYYFREIFYEIGRKEYPQLTLESSYADAFCLLQLAKPEALDVIVCPNLIGDIISDNGAFTQGGMGLAAGANIGYHHAMFEPIHGSAPELADRNIANPYATICALVLLLDWLAIKAANPVLHKLASTLEQAIRINIKRGILTQDLIEASKSYSLDKVGKNINDTFIQLLTWQNNL